MSGLFDGSKNRAVVLGLDGTPFSFLEKEIEAGNLPNMAYLAAKGALSRMETEIPTISSVAWASFMTGANPAEHGIFGFTDRKPGTYELYFPNYSNLKVNAIWEDLSDRGKRCCVVNVPSTYPARPLNGVLVSGFVAPNLERATYPREAYEYLNSIGYRIDVDAAKARESLDLLLEDLHVTLEKRREALLHFWEAERWDLFVGVFTGTDRLHHFIWRQYEQDDPVYASEFVRYYKRIDEIIGEFAELLPDEVALFMLSDHGFCSIEKEAFINSRLRDEGWLAYRTDQPRMLPDIDPSRTMAYCMDPGRIYFNLEGREPEGIVSSSDLGKRKNEMIDFLMSLEDSEKGVRIIERVVAREEIYDGPELRSGPELIAVPRRGYDLKGSMANPGWLEEGHLTGMHTHDDAFSYVEAGESPAFIRELAPMIIDCCGG